MIYNLTGAHIAGMSNKNVTNFHAYNTNTKYFPKGLELIFKNLKRISIIDGPLKELTQEDLEPFPELVEMYLYNNDIEVLEDDIFNFNPKLAIIQLNNNKLRAIGDDVFNNLNNLVNLNLSHNLCINKKAENDSTALESIISHIRLHCNIMDFMYIDKVINRLEDSLICTNSETLPIFQAKYEEIRSQLKTSKHSTSLFLNNKLQKVFNYTQQNLFTIKDTTSSEIKNLNVKISNLESLIKASTGQATNKSDNTERDLKTKIDNLEKAMTAKVDNIERILRNYISADTKTTSDFQSKVDARLKVQNYKIDNNSEIQGSTQSILVASCAFLVSIIIYIAYKKFLFRVMEVEEERNGIY